MVFFEGSAPNEEALSVRRRTKNKFNSNRGKSSNNYKGRQKSGSKRDKFCKYYKKDKHFIGECYKM
jgi:hypothetical protein